MERKRPIGNQAWHRKIATGLHAETWFPVPKHESTREISLPTLGEVVRQGAVALPAVFAGFNFVTGNIAAGFRQLGVSAGMMVLAEGSRWFSARINQN